MLKKLQKVDEDTNLVIDEIRSILFKIGVRSSRERAWEIFRAVHKLPYEILIKRNPEIKYQGCGQHISSKHGSQLLVIKDIGKFELKGVSMRKSQDKRASIRFIPSKDIQNMLKDNVIVKN